MRTVTVSHNWYSFPWCSGIAIPTVFGVPSDISCRDQGRVCRVWSGLVGMEVELGHSLTVHQCSTVQGRVFDCWWGQTGSQGSQMLSTVGTVNRIVDWMYNGYGEEIINLWHQWDFSVLGYDMQCGGDEARPQ